MTYLVLVYIYGLAMPLINSFRIFENFIFTQTSLLNYESIRKDDARVKYIHSLFFYLITFMIIHGKKEVRHFLIY